MDCDQKFCKGWMFATPTSALWDTLRGSTQARFVSSRARSKRSTSNFRWESSCKPRLKEKKFKYHLPYVNLSVAEFYWIFTCAWKKQKYCYLSHLKKTSLNLELKKKQKEHTLENWFHSFFTCPTNPFRGQDFNSSYNGPGGSCLIFVQLVSTAWSQQFNGWVSGLCRVQ